MNISFKVILYSTLLIATLLTPKVYAGLEAQPTMLDFTLSGGSFGPSNETKVLKIKNNSSDSITFRVDHNCSNDFFVNDLCGPLSPNESCNISVRFWPNKNGFYRCDLELFEGFNKIKSISIQGTK